MAGTVHIRRLSPGLQSMSDLVEDEGADGVRGDRLDPATNCGVALSNEPHSPRFAAACVVALVVQARSKSFILTTSIVSLSIVPHSPSKH
jgi:hypothetical protein